MAKEKKKKAKKAKMVAKTAVDQKVADQKTVSQDVDAILAGTSDYSEREAMKYLLRIIESTDYRSPFAYHICSAAKKRDKHINR